jgi:dihydroneopterin aldolase
MDKVYIRGLKVECIVGVYGWERQLPRPLLFDLELGADLRAAAASDHVRDVIDYAAVSAAVTKVAQERQPALLEALGETIARALFDQFPILSLRLNIAKPGAVPEAKAVGIEIERRREDYAACGR